MSCRGRCVGAESTGVRCPGCQKVVPRAARYCVYCGEEIGGKKESGEPG